MIRSLRWKFVAINMSLVALVLMIVFATIVVSSYNEQRRGSEDALHAAMRLDIYTPSPKFEVGGGRGKKTHESFLPVFTVLVDAQGNIQAQLDGHVSIDSEILIQAVEQAMAQQEASGVLPDVQLRYLYEQHGSYTKIAFVDLAHEADAIRHLVSILLLVGAGGLIAFFAISLFLSAWALRPVARAWEVQRAFIADASHELKTPLTVMMANLALVSAHPRDTVESQAQWIENSRLEAVRMKQLVEQMLFLAKADADHVPTARLPFSLTDVVWNAALSFEPVAYERGVSLNSQIAPDVTMLGDEAQIRQLVAILLDNACKYVEDKGAIECNLIVSQERAKLTVHNSGTQVPQAQLSRVFERFYRADSARARTEGGYGLGLSIAERIVAEHHGRIAANSEPEQGTTFTVLLPLRPKKTGGQHRTRA